MQNRAEINYNHYLCPNPLDEEIPEDTKEFLNKESAFYDRLRGVLESISTCASGADGDCLSLGNTIIDPATGEFDPAGVHAMSLVLAQEFQKRKRLAEKMAKIEWLLNMLKKESDEL